MPFYIWTILLGSFHVNISCLILSAFYSLSILEFLMQEKVRIRKVWFVKFVCFSDNYWRWWNSDENIDQAADFPETNRRKYKFSMLCSEPRYAFQLLSVDFYNRLRFPQTLQKLLVFSKIYFYLDSQTDLVCGKWRGYFSDKLFFLLLQ